jgi:hypothetical protein
MKTLLDALRMPHNLAELPTGDMPKADEAPLFVLLEDDSLISHLSVTTDRLLEQPSSPLDAFLLIRVRVKVTKATINNISLGV